MNCSLSIFFGLLLSLALSFWGLIFIPQTQIGQQAQATNEDTGELYPAVRAGLAKKGAQVYRSEGCAECHSQQVRDKSFATDIERGWGPRFTVAQDYLGDYPVMLGLQRVGPDLANISLRRPDANWQLQHLYDPKSLVEHSTMPAYHYLFDERRIVAGRKSERVLKIENVREGYEIVPTEEAEALVAYLLSLRSEVELREGPVPKAKGVTPKAAVPVGTNVTPSVTTNAATAPAATAPTQAAPTVK